MTELRCPRCGSTKVRCHNNVHTCYGCGFNGSNEADCIPLADGELAVRSGAEEDQLTEIVTDEEKDAEVRRVAAAIWNVESQIYEPVDRLLVLFDAQPDSTKQAARHKALSAITAMQMAEADTAGRNPLTKTRTVMVWEQQAQSERGPVFSAADEEDGTRLLVLTVDQSVWADFGYPEIITVTIEPGDLLNEPIPPIYAFEAADDLVVTRPGGIAVAQCYGWEGMLSASDRARDLARLLNQANEKEVNR